MRGGTSAENHCRKVWIGFVCTIAVPDSGAEVDEDKLVDYTPPSCLSDDERFKDVEKLQLRCMAYDTEANKIKILQ